MNRISIFLLSTFFLLIKSDMYGQNVTEAIRYSNQVNHGTARISGVAGSFGALGGDIGVALINPAGIADFRKDEIVLAPAIYGRSSQATFINPDTIRPQTSEIGSKLGLGTIGVVFSKNIKKSNKTTNLAISIQNQSFFRERVNYSGFSKGSITHRFEELANGKDVGSLDPFEADLAYITGAIFDFDGDLSYQTDFKESAVVEKGQTIERYGRLNELNITWAGKYDKFNFGLGLGIPIINFEEQKEYQEQDDGDFIPTFDELVFNESLITTGTGLNIKGGFQAMIAQRFRAGIALHTPSWMILEDEYETSLTYQFEQQGPIRTTSDSPLGQFQYRLVTPWKAILSGGMLFMGENTKGFVNLDVEYIDFRNNEFDFSRFSDNPTDLDRQQEVNENIFLQLGNAINIRLGTELVFGHFRVRGGLAALSSPYDLQNEIDLTSAIGAGYRGDRFYIDLSFNRSAFVEGYVPYLMLDNEDNQFIQIDQANTNLNLTIGFKLR